MSEIGLGQRLQKRRKHTGDTDVKLGEYLSNLIEPVDIIYGGNFRINGFDLS